MAKYSLAQIKESHRQKLNWERQYPLSFWIVRPISFRFAYLVLHLTESPSRVAGLGFVLGLSACAALLAVPEIGLWPGVALLLLYDLMDATDGTVARATGNVTYYGKFLDGMIGDIVEGSYLLCLGAGLYRGEVEQISTCTVLQRIVEQPALLLVAGGVVTLAKLHGSSIQASYYSLLRTMDAARGEARADLHADIQSSRYRGNPAYLVFNNLHTFDVEMAGLVIASAFGAVDFFLAGYAVYYAVRFCVVAAFYYGRARRNLGKG